MKQLFIYLLICLCSLQLIAQTNPEMGMPLITNYSTKVYKGHQQVWSILQDNQDVMYFGTSTGITTYDGVNWRQIRLPGTWVSTIHHQQCLLCRE